MSLPPIPNTKLIEDPTRDAIWKRWLNLSFKNVNAVSSALYVSSAAFHASSDFATSSHPHSLSTMTSSLGADVALSTNVYYDGPSIAQGTSGTWFVSGTVTLEDTAAGANFSLKLWDGTTVIASARANISALNQTRPVSLSGYLVSPAGDIRISVKDDTLTTGLIRFNSSGNSKDSTITAIRIA